MQAINNTVSGLKTKKINKLEEKNLMTGSKVNNSIARDLKSNAGDLPR